MLFRSLRRKEADLTRLWAMHEGLSAHLASKQDLLRSTVNARAQDLQRFKAAVDSYKANQRLSASYEADLEDKLQVLMKNDKDLRASRDKLQQKYDELCRQFEASQDDLAKARLTIRENCASCDDRSGDVNQQLNLLASFDPHNQWTQTSTSVVMTERAPFLSHPTNPTGSGSDMQQLPHASISAASPRPDTPQNLIGNLPAVFNDVLEAYNEGQEASFTYEAFLLEQCEMARAEIGDLRKCNETLVADFGDLLASYKDVVHKLVSSERTTSPGLWAVRDPDFSGDLTLAS